MTVEKKRFAPTTEEALGGLVGTLECSYADLARLFGEPNAAVDGYKTSTEWSVRDAETGQVFAIYDWKDTALFDSRCPSVEEFRAKPRVSWCIGGQSAPAALINWVAEQLRAGKE